MVPQLLMAVKITFFSLMVEGKISFAILSKILCGLKTSGKVVYLNLMFEKPVFTKIFSISALDQQAM